MHAMIRSSLHSTISPIRRTVRHPNLRVWWVLPPTLLLLLGCGPSPQARQAKIGPLVGNSVGMKFVPIPTGKCQLGDKEFAKYDNGPHEVEMTRVFYLGRTEVTQAQFAQVTGKKPWKGRWASLYTEKRDDGATEAELPATYINWGDAVEFCKKLSELPEEKDAGRSYRLPTSDEWEYACRAGSRARYSWGNNIGHAVEYAWCTKNDDGMPHPVGQKLPNAWGLHDMHGNVLEWCEYSDPDDKTIKMMRGSNGWDGLHCSHVMPNAPAQDPKDLALSQGFRVVMEVNK